MSGSCRHGQVPYYCIDCYFKKHKLKNKSREWMKSRIEELEEENGALKETIESMESANPPAGGGNE